MKEVRILDIMPYDKTFIVDGHEELCHATGYEVCDGNPKSLEDWWNEYIDSAGNLHYGR